MENKDYVSEDVAELLEKKGCPCFMESSFITKEKSHRILPIPPLYMAQKWLREKKNIYILIEPYFGGDFDCVLSAFFYKITDNNIYGIGCCDINFHTYEEALNEGIKQALEYI